MSRFQNVGAKGKALADGAKNAVAVIDQAAGLMFSAKDIGGAMDHASAVKVVAEMKLAGFNDWRLPTAEELFALADRSRFNPAIDTAFFPTCKSDWYWTGTAWAAQPAGYAWVVGFGYGSSHGNRRSNNARVRAVRSVSGAGQ